MPEEFSASDVSRPRPYDMDHPHYSRYFWSAVSAVLIGSVGLVVSGLEAQNAQITTGRVAPEVIEHATRIEHAGMGVVHIADMVGVDYLED